MSDKNFDLHTTRECKSIPEDAEDYTHEKITYSFEEDGMIYEVSTIWFDCVNLRKEFDESDGCSGWEYDERARKFIDWSTQKKVAKELIERDGETYEYDVYYKRYRLKDDRDKRNPDAPDVICPKCLNDSFILKYGDYELLALCPCGHSMTVYDG